VEKEVLGGRQWRLCGSDEEDRGKAARRGKGINYDKDKVDEYALALLYFAVLERKEGLGARA